MSTFKFKQFEILQADNAMKVGTDAMVLGALVNPSGHERMLDIGSGTGVIALMLAQRAPDLRIEAIELDVVSSKEAEFNFQNSPWSDRLKVHQGDFLEFSSDEKFDLLVSNPPYFQTRNENPDERKARTRHESFLPMDKMLKHAFDLAAENASLWVIVPVEVLDSWLEVASNIGWFISEIILIVGKENGTVKRTILHFTKRKSKVKMDSLTIRRENNNYTEGYKELTRDFHFNKLP